MKVIHTNIFGDIEKKEICFEWKYKTNLCLDTRIEVDKSRVKQWKMKSPLKDFIENGEKTTIIEESWATVDIYWVGHSLYFEIFDMDNYSDETDNFPDGVQQTIVFKVPSKIQRSIIEILEYLSY